MLSHRPAWQTEELAEEWVDQDEHSSARWQDSVSSHAVSSSDISLTEALPSTFIRGGSSSPAPSAIGTFVVKQDVPAAPLLQKTPGKRNKSQIKDFFSPMPLEMMFNPPSPPSTDALPLPSSSHQTTAPIVPSRLSKVHVPGDKSSEHEADDEILETDIPNMVGFDGRRPGMNCQFTFSIPDPNQGAPMAQSTPSGLSPAQPNAPPIDPRLRLFQFQYDTFTRDHLSAMVDSIAVNSPSGGSGSPNGSGNILSRVTEAEGESMSRMRSTKRIKLSPATDFSEAVSSNPGPSRPPSGRDYVGESRNLMEQIRLARDFSTISTVASANSHAGDESISHTGAPQGESGRRSFLIKYLSFNVP
jgi:protein NUD1